MNRRRKSARNSENQEELWTEEPSSEKITENAPITFEEEEEALRSHQTTAAVLITKAPAEANSLNIAEIENAESNPVGIEERAQGDKENMRKNYEKQVPGFSNDGNTEATENSIDSNEVREDSLIKIMRGLKQENEELSRKLKETSNFSDHLLEVYNKKENEYIKDKGAMRERMEELALKSTRAEAARNEVVLQNNRLKQELSELNSKFAKEKSQREKALQKVEKYKTLIDKNLPNKIYNFRTFVKFSLKYALIVFIQIYGRKTILRLFPKAQRFAKYLFFFIIFDFIKMNYI